MALCYFKLEGWETVIKHCNKVLELDSKKIKALYRRGVAHTHLGNVRELIYFSSLKLQPISELDLSYNPRMRNYWKREKT